MEEPSFIETTYQGMTLREQKMLRAMQLLMHRNHDFKPSECEECLDAAGFLTLPGYQGGNHMLTR